MLQAYALAATDGKFTAEVLEKHFPLDYYHGQLLAAMWALPKRDNFDPEEQFQARLQAICIGTLQLRQQQEVKTSPDKLHHIATAMVNGAAGDCATCMFNVVMHELDVSQDDIDTLLQRTAQAIFDQSVRDCYLEEIEVSRKRASLRQLDKITEELAQLANTGIDLSTEEDTLAETAEETKKEETVTA
jgi:phenylpropionate dioxygenase-like ring-hydroxylating dioxygenase large terminal subunit